MLEIQNISKSFKNKRVLDNVSFYAENGTITGFVGPNGAGKTTTMKAIVGLVTPDTGRTFVDGKPYANSLRPLERVGSYLSADELPPRLTPLRLFEYLCDTQKMDRSKARQAITSVGLHDVRNAKIGSFSFGMKQRLGIALALVGDPKNIILDEPFNGLDPDGVLWLRETLQTQASRGKAVLLSSHLLSELSLLVNRVVMLSEGRVVRQDSIANLSAEQSNRVYLESPQIELLCSCLERSGYRIERVARGVYVHDTNPVTVGRLAYESGACLSHLSLAASTLEDVFRASTRGSYQPQGSSEPNK
jgi:ABC-2 type transport system ATP-binding protein